MPTVRFLPEGVRVQVRPGTTLFRAAQMARVPIRSRCGGRAACLMCKVKVPDSAGLSPANLNEQRKLGELLKSGYRLSCQARVIGEVAAEIPEDPLKAAVRAQLDRLKESEE